MRERRSNKGEAYKPSGKATFDGWKMSQDTTNWSAKRWHHLMPRITPCKNAALNHSHKLPNVDRVAGYKINRENYA